MKQHAPAAMRNRGPILAALRETLPPDAVVLEIASGTGEHAVFFTAELPGVTWRPSEVSAEARASIDAYRRDARLDRLDPAVHIDVRDADWGAAAEGIDAIVCCNMIHITPWSCCQGLIAGASRCLEAGGQLILYGPFRFEGEGGVSAPSNLRFSESLQRQDPSWAVRELSDVTALAAKAGMTREAVHALPANNHVTVFLKR